MNNAWAIDAKTGQQIWRYQRSLPAGLNVCCGRSTAGSRVYGDRLFMTTLDAHLIALEMKTGKVIWDIEIADYQAGLRGTVAPLDREGQADCRHRRRRIRDPRLPGCVRASIPASARGASGRFRRPANPAARPGRSTSCERGGAPTWLTGHVRPRAEHAVSGAQATRTRISTATSRPGDNLYAASLVALDPDTGKLKWHFQFTPHDTHDWDANQMPVLADLTIGGQARKVGDDGEPQRLLLHARSHQRQVHRREAVRQPELGIGFDSEGRPIEIAGHAPTVEGTLTCPDLFGGTNFMAPSFDAATGLFFVTARIPARTSSRRTRQTPTSAIAPWAAPSLRSASALARCAPSIR